MTTASAAAATAVATIAAVVVVATLAHRAEIAELAGEFGVEAVLERHGLDASRRCRDRLAGASGHRRVG